MAPAIAEPILVDKVPPIWNKAVTIARSIHNNNNHNNNKSKKKIGAKYKIK